MSSIDQKIGANHNIYRGLYPIREVKQYYRREFVNGKPLYICLWGDCDFKTWKYSQHIARHIHLKHIGIKELKCDEKGCEKTFKRPESLVQHQKNHLCGFGIDSLKMKDPNNVCGVKNIKKYYFRELDNDYYVFGCKWTACEFVTNNSGSIRRHVHNQHICPHSLANNNNNTTVDKISITLSKNTPIIDSNNNYNVDQPMVEMIELDPQSIIPKINNKINSVIDGNDDNLYDNPTKPIDIEDDIEANAIYKSTTGGLYSLKNYSDLYRKVKIDGEVYFKCNCNQFTTKSQISLVRHIWTDIGRNEFDCNVNDCDAKFDNEFSLYKHKKTEHNFESNNSNITSNTCLDKYNDSKQTHNYLTHKSISDPLNGLSSVIITPIPRNVSITPVSLVNGQPLPQYYDTSYISKSVTQLVPNNTPLEKFSHYFIRVLVNNDMIYECKCGYYSTKCSHELIQHIQTDHKELYAFDCQQCRSTVNHNSKHLLPVVPTHTSFPSIPPKPINSIIYTTNKTINTYVNISDHLVVNQTQVPVFSNKTSVITSRFHTIP
ncbi:uncharacterized protein LOC128951215 [Oppia nitens]|uniref:uncharacterized protein LOC128951215 n=1 Tax=Oppia nitens TaxID=1686743 RepID=UPI0023D99B19|nr:uncharacterized protein LOC128951215 [Oppia nitens]